MNRYQYYRMPEINKLEVGEQEMEDRAANWLLGLGGTLLGLYAFISLFNTTSCSAKYHREHAISIDHCHDSSPSYIPGKPISQFEMDLFDETMKREKER